MKVGALCCLQRRLSLLKSHAAGSILPALAKRQERGTHIGVVYGSSEARAGLPHYTLLFLDFTGAGCNHLAIADVADYAPSDRWSEGAFAFWDRIPMSRKGGETWGTRLNLERVNG